LRHAPLSSLVMTSLWQDTAVGARFIATLLDQEQRLQGQGTLLEVFAHWWNMGSDAYRACLAEATVRRRNDGAATLQLWCWHRLLEYESERSSLWSAVVGWHDAFATWRDQQPLDSPLRPTSAAAWFRLYGGLASPQLWETTKAARAHADDHDPQGMGVLLDAVFDLALPILSRHPRQALASCFQMAMAVADPYCAQPTEPHLHVGAQRLRVRFPELVAAADGGLETDHPTEVDALHFIEDIAVRIRMMDEALASVPTQKPVSAAADDSEDDGDSDDDQVEQEPPVRIIDEPTRVLAVNIPSSAGARWAYQGDLLPLDTTALVEAPALTTLLDYVGFLIELQRGGDVMAMFDRCGLTVTSWGAVASAWGTMMSTTPSLGMRMAMLLQGTWVQLTDDA
jgi:hypothetical protein